jgi:hypothetical protein
MENKDKTAAFPVSFESENATGNEGMYLRDYFAAKAMQSIVNNYMVSQDAGLEIATKAYEIADAMLKERNK